MQQLVRAGQQQKHNRHRGARPLLHQIVLEAVPLAGVRTDLEKVINHPQAENSELYNVLKIA